MFALIFSLHEQDLDARQRDVGEGGELGRAIELLGK
jgi:hypothetical protein